MAADRRRPSTGTRLDQPRTNRYEVRVRLDAETLGRISESIARYLGSWSFIGVMTVFVAAWISWNSLAPASLRFDPFPFILLTLMLSLQASYAAPLILLAQNRQADRDKIQYQDDRTRTDRIIADVEFNARELAALRIALGDLATRDYLRGELRDVLEEVLGTKEPQRTKRKKRTKPKRSKNEPAATDALPVTPLLPELGLGAGPQADEAGPLQASPERPGPPPTAAGAPDTGPADGPPQGPAPGSAPQGGPAGTT